ncbi:DUF6157 family protein [Xanthocytophaga agilis]|uniref:DUF6157 family protein n=1 Tax=Xanthocytophaga agilis TaxID=3048010 RepID=A0AAE3QX43_9BACT|nr:DUF6157 family protein [Xanthocytophaga agilis]MDJ1499679.1 DUF6157 family protein [Xanthocytophaga agilis]
MSKEISHTTNYFDTFIEVAEDTKVSCGTIPKSKGGNKTVAECQYELLIKNPYKFTSDDIFFQVFAERNNLTEQEYGEARKNFFSKGQPCFRSSPLTKTYGFGVHSNSEGKVAIFGMETELYQKLQSDPKIKKIKAMRTSKK